MVKKEVALLKKAGAPAKMIKHEEREGALMGLKKGGKPKGYQQGGSAEADAISGSSHSFREVDGKYMHNNQEVSKQEFDRRKAGVDQRIKTMRGPDTSKMSPRERSKSAFDELDAEIQKKPYKKGGMAGYAEGGGAQSDKELAAKEDARAEKALRDQQKGYKEHYKREEAENRADRKAVKDAMLYIPRKIGEGARSVYDSVMGKKEGGKVHSDVAMDKKIVKKAVHKHEAAMHPGKPMTKLKKGGQPKKLEVGGYLMSSQAPAMGAAPTGSAPSALSDLAKSAQQFNAQASADRMNAQPAADKMRSQAAMQNRPSGLSGLARGMSRNPAPGGRFPAPPMNQAGAAARAAGTAPTYAQRPSTPMKKGGAAKKGVPVHSRTPKC
jgi:hypothetical protein